MLAHTQCIHTLHCWHTHWLGQFTHDTHTHTHTLYTHTHTHTHTVHTHIHFVHGVHTFTAHGFFTIPNHFAHGHTPTRYHTTPVLLYATFCNYQHFWHGIPQLDTTQLAIAQHTNAQHNRTQHNTAQHNTILHDTKLCNQATTRIRNIHIPGTRTHDIPHAHTNTTPDNSRALHATQTQHEHTHTHTHDTYPPRT